MRISIGINVFVLIYSKAFRQKIGCKSVGLLYRHLKRSSSCKVRREKELRTFIAYNVQTCTSFLQDFEYIRSTCFSCPVYWGFCFRIDTIHIRTLIQQSLNSILPFSMRNLVISFFPPEAAQCSIELPSSSFAVTT